MVSGMCYTAIQSGHYNSPTLEYNNNEQKLTNSGGIIKHTMNQRTHED